MTGKTYFGIFLFTFILFLAGCKKDNSLLGSPDTTNLILNPSFEENGQPSLKHWYVQDSSKINFSRDTPVNGGEWSVYLHAEWYGPLPKAPAYFVPISTGKHILKFSIYGKSKTVTGSAFLLLKRDNDLEIVDQNLITDRVWTKYSTTDTLNITEGDSLYILLYGGGTEVADGITYFDSVKLEFIDGE